jgi:hypothetical protein
LKEFKDLFANIQVIRNSNTKLPDDLHPRPQAWPPHQQLGDIFVQVAMFLKVYTGTGLPPSHWNNKLLY